MKKTLFSLLILSLFLYGVGTQALAPSLRLLRDTQWDFSLFPILFPKKIIALLWFALVLVGFMGWAKGLRKIIFKVKGGDAEEWACWALALVLFSFYVFALGVNGILVKPLVLLFFLPALTVKKEEAYIIWPSSKTKIWKWMTGLALVLWAFEFLSPPILWDALLDHFRFAEEVARLHQIPFHWTNHTGDMPKFAETALAGFWTLGGETLAKLTLALGLLFMVGLFSLFGEMAGIEGSVGLLILVSCPVFLAIFSWGYVEGFLALFEAGAFYCLLKSSRSGQKGTWLGLSTLFFGVAFSIKYTALLAVLGWIALVVRDRFRSKPEWKLNWKMFFLFLIPIFPWCLRNYLANGNPVYPLASWLFGGPPGFNPSMESDLWKDTGLASSHGLEAMAGLLWRGFFTPFNGVGACWTPLVWMSLPWMPSLFKNDLGRKLIFLTLVFFAGWILFCTDLRHASGGLILLSWIGALAWAEGFRRGKSAPRVLFSAGTILALWLLLAAQWTVTAPYAGAFGMENQTLRLKRHYYFNLDSFAAYRVIEKNSSNWDRVLAFGLYQTYPLGRISFVDFFWKKPTLLRWAAQCKTAEELAEKVRENGVKYILYQREEAVFMSAKEKDFFLTGMTPQEYVRFWRLYSEPLCEYENTFVYRLRTIPLEKPRALDELPGLQEQELLAAERGKTGALEGLTVDYPFLAEGWKRLAQERAGAGKWGEALAAGERAGGLGLQSLELCDTMAKCFSHKREKTKARVWRGFEAKRAEELSGVLSDVTQFYGGLE